MISQTWILGALAAYNAGDKSGAVKIVLDNVNEIRSNSIAVQILALSSEDDAERLSLLEYGAFELFLGDPNVLFNLGVAYEEAGNKGGARSAYRQCLRVQPDHAGALNNLSEICRRDGRSDDAWELARLYIDSNYSTEGLELRFAKIADEAGEPYHARRWFEKAVRANPNSPHQLWEKAIGDLRDGRFKQGFRGYEARTEVFEHDELGQVTYDLPRWGGERLNQETLLLHKEQGLGDMIMYASCFADVASVAGGPVHVAIQRPLARLFDLNFPDFTIWAADSFEGAGHQRNQAWLSNVGVVDFQCPIGSLGILFRTNGFPQAKPYLVAGSRDVEIWRSRIDSLSGSKGAQKLRVGLVISARRDFVDGNGIADGLKKSIPPVEASRLAMCPGICWVGLHDRRTVELLMEIPNLDVIDTSHWLFDLADTAALIAGLDIVVTVDTAVAHLAGAMGKKVLLMLRRCADWRWGRNQARSYWYHDVEIFRQSSEGLWSEVVLAVTNRLKELQTADFTLPCIPRRGL